MNTEEPQEPKTKIELAIESAIIDKVLNGSKNPFAEADKLFATIFQPNPNATWKIFRADGRDFELDYQDPLEADELLEDALDAEIVFHMRGPGEDPLDAELAEERHLAACTTCRETNGRVCAHCLELTVCKRVSVPTRCLIFSAEIMYVSPQYLELCRPCRNQAYKGALDVRE